MQFCDQARIFLQSGSGGSGCVSFRREKNIEFGGPDGGHGGDGANIFLQASCDLVTLVDFRYRPHYRAPSGKSGQGRHKAGAAGEDLILKVPAGTEVWVEDRMVADLIHHGQNIMVLKGGRGGRGNASFTTSTCRAPREFGPGEMGTELTIELRLKLLAQIGIVGLPNAGKSSLLGALTSAHPKVGAYPFTTLKPQLGTLVTPQFSEMVIADLPGLIAGAHEGKGLGHRFLRHGERCQQLIHVLDGTKENLWDTYQEVRYEMEQYHPSFIHKQEMIVISKCDLLSDAQKQHILTTFPKPFFLVSSQQPETLEPLLRALYALVDIH